MEVDVIKESTVGERIIASVLSGEVQAETIMSNKSV